MEVVLNSYPLISVRVSLNSTGTQNSCNSSGSHFGILAARIRLDFHEINHPPHLRWAALWLVIRNSRTAAGQNAEIALPAPVRVHGGPKTPPEARRDSWGAHSIDCCVRPCIQTDRAPESLVRHVPFCAALDAERCRQSIRKVDLGPTRSV